MQTRKYQWKKKEVDQPTSLHLAKELNVSKVISEILVARGIHDFDSAQNYFRPNETQFQDGFLMIRRPPRSTHCISSAASDVYKRQI